MSRIAYVNGRYLPRTDAMVAVEDRGYQFADGVYEVCEVRGGRLVDEGRHMARLARSLGELSIARPMSPAPLAIVLRETIRRNVCAMASCTFRLRAAWRDGIFHFQLPIHDRPWL
jgi:D-alanine transaminase